MRDGILSFEEGIGNWRMTIKLINFQLINTSLFITI